MNKLTLQDMRRYNLNLRCEISVAYDEDTPKEMKERYSKFVDVVEQIANSAIDQFLISENLAPPLTRQYTALVTDLNKEEEVVKDTGWRGFSPPNMH